MNEILAGKLLAKVLNWDQRTIRDERPILLSFASFKYDDYQPFFPGMRFIESLALWLNQFDTLQERRIAYNFIKNNIIYISYDEMEHLIEMAYPDCIKKILIERTALQLDYFDWEINKIISSKEFKMMLRQTVFLGLSDGAHIGLFRRSNPNLSHEQIIRTHEISEDRALNMIEELRKEIDIINSDSNNDNNVKFKNIFLLDDFSASGMSYIRKEGGSYKGKLAKFYYTLCSNENDALNMYDLNNINVFLILYVATVDAKNYIKKNAETLFKNIPFDIKVIHILDSETKITQKMNPNLWNLLIKYYDPSIEKPSYKKGKHDKPFLGFNECSLPLILYHNTPNNTVPLLWFEYNKRRYRGLFPRINRHSD